MNAIYTSVQMLHTLFKVHIDIVWKIYMNISQIKKIKWEKCVIFKLGILIVIR